jgi:glycosyltransferase 2 family protein
VKWDWKAFLGILISAVLVWWVLRDVDPGEVWREVEGANWWLLLAAVAVATSGFLNRSLRWKLLLHPMAPGTRLRNRFAAVNIGFAVNNLLPARIGEFARAWSIARLEPVTVSGAVGSLVVERFLDAIGLLILFGAAVLSPSFPSDATIAGRRVGSVLVGAGLSVGALALILVLVIAFPRFWLRLIDRFARFLPGESHQYVRELMHAFIEGLGALRDKRLLVGGILWSLWTWAWNGVSFWLAFHAFGIDQGYATALFVQAVIAIGVAVPSAPGYFGTFHAAALVALSQVYGVGEGPTLAFAFGYHLGGFFPVTIMGMWFASRIGFSLSDLGHAEEVVESELHHDAESADAVPVDAPAADAERSTRAEERGV